MYAQLETLVPTPGTGPDDAVQRLDAAADRPGFTGGYVLGQLGHDRLTVLTFSSSVAEGFEVEDEWAGHDPEQPARAAVVLWFDGPIADPVLKAAKYGGQHRLTPAIQATPGTVRGWALLDPARRAMCVINLVTSVDALDALAQAVNSTELLPGEDPALLPGPDRVETSRVLSVNLAVKESSS
jgi:hypothetical protein